MSDNEKSDNVGKLEEKPKISAYIALILAILFFSGIFQQAPGPLAAFDFTNVLGSFGVLGEISEGAGALADNFTGLDGTGVRDGWLFALTLAPVVMFAIGIVKIVENMDGLRAAQRLLNPLLRPILGIPGGVGLALISSLQSTDAGAAMTRELFETGVINEKERLIFTMFQFSAGGTITNFLSSGAALFPFFGLPIFIPLIIIFIFKFVSANLIRLYANKFIYVEEGEEQYDG